MAKEQNFEHHAQLVPGFHGVLFLLLVAIFIGSVVNLWHAVADHSRLYNASLISALSFASLVMYYYVRVFPLKAQDRAIRAEENLRHFALTGKLIDPRVTIQQVIALRFAPDAEFVELTRRAAEERLEPKAIKQAIKNWRADYYRV